MSPLDNDEKKRCEDHQKLLMKLEIELSVTQRLLWANLTVLLAGIVNHLLK